MIQVEDGLLKSPIPASEVAVSRRRGWALVVGTLTLGLLLLLVFGLWVADPGLVYLDTGFIANPGISESGQTEGEARASRELESLAPRGRFVVIDSFGGTLSVYQGEDLLRQAVSSAGSGSALRDPRNGKFWVFETPIGEHRVQRKARDPVWNKPDWAFVEEGRVPPPLGHPERADRISLGDYALYLGDGYLIHGTLFQTTLGNRVTHGCVRLGDQDLEWLFNNVPVGSRVWIY
ncbi:MAG: L,D-transpeptidase [Thermoanaerobaculia bacterium]|nr:L,D-transpeptidase [Thermoanaerobaculia bacterium]